MAILTVPGMMTLFSNIGRDSAENLLDVAGIWGDREAGKFWQCFPHELRIDDVKHAMDTWFSNALGAISTSARDRYVQLHQALVSNARVDTACDRLGMTPRTLQREFRCHLGISPKQVTNLYRLQRSVRANVEPLPPSPAQEFADQSHAIREWNRYLNRTPGRYRAEDRSAIAKAFASSTQQASFDPTIFYL
ncbi:MAG: helix-turn-helix domain-containing protein [Cyanobacteria bacterium J06639_1]